MRLGSLGLFSISLVMGIGAVAGTRAYIASHAATAPPTTRVVAERPDVRQIVVAKQDIPFGAPITLSVISLGDWVGGTVPDGAFDAPASFDGPEPRYARVNITAGEPILPDKITLPGIKPTLSAAVSDNMRAVTIRVNDVLGVAGLVSPGDLVDVLVTVASNGRDRAETAVETLLQGVKVLALDQDAAGTPGGRGDVRTVTLEVHPETVSQVALAANVGTLSLALRGRGDTQSRAPDRLTLSMLFGGNSSGSDEAVETADTSDAAGQSMLSNVTELVRDNVDGLAQLSPEAAAALQGLIPEPAPVTTASVPKEIVIYHGTERSVHKVPAKVQGEISGN